jgi:hypothetical protein
VRIVIDRTNEVTRPDPLVASGTLSVRISLSPNVQHVKAGTPLRPSLLGWEPDTDGGHTVLFAATPGHGGANVNACREVVLDTRRPSLLTPCARYKADSIDPTGYVSFAPSDDGSYVALSDELILLTPDF